ncbi:MAG: hypothetical protein H6611_03510 [Ignavibacteriales bacterium]|nr:hypothetical protein [Ignavibacteriales bacterium]
MGEVMRILYFLIIIATIFLFGCNNKNDEKNIQPVYIDKPYLQDYSIKYYFEENLTSPQKVNVDRNNIIQILNAGKIYKPANGHFQYPGKLKVDQNYQPLLDMKINDFITYKNQFVYLTDQAILSNAWAGKLFIKHELKNANILTAGNDFDFMISDDKNIIYLNESKIIWEKTLGSDHIKSIKFSKINNGFFILGDSSLYFYSISKNTFDVLYIGNLLTCFDIDDTNKIITVGTNDGFFEISYSGEIKSELNNKLPWTELTSIKIINGTKWFGSTKGAFMLREDGKFNYYNSERWLPGNYVFDISEDKKHEVLILTDKGLGKICFEEMTLYDKAVKFEEQVRERHIRYGINVDVSSVENFDLSTNTLKKADSDNLWTSMYLVSQLFRYLVTKSEIAKQNCFEAFEAMERLHTLSGIKGLFGRTFERKGYQEFGKEYRNYVEDYWYPNYNNMVSWYHANDQWDWRGSASSDQTIGQIFAMTMLAEYIDDPEWKNRAVNILDNLMTYIVENDFYLIDKNGKPSLWGRWNPEYVNRFQSMVGDRKICSSNIIAFLQTAYKHTGKEIFKEKANYLMNEHGYLENLMRPFSEIGPVPEDADNWSKMLSEEWNHSDDEMYFLAYWALYPYAFNDSLKSLYKDAIKDHWNFVRPEKNSLWNFCYAMTGTEEFDLDESIWHLKEWPLDMLYYEIYNSHRKDIEFVEPGFMGHETKEVFPPDERPMLKHNMCQFQLDNPYRSGEISAGHTFLLPYWMGRFLGVISEPKK